ncbi:MAG: NADH-quinone oxidoreductase subunit J [Anaerolineae bacterium]
MSFETIPWGDVFIQIAWWAMTLCTLGGAIGVVMSERIFHSALFLVLSLFGVAGYYVILSAGFLAVVQLMVYVGAIAILILFAIMFSRRIMQPNETTENQQWLAGLVAASGLFAALLVIINSVKWPVADAQPGDDTVLQLGLAFLGSYLIPFMVVSVLLSAALIGAIFLAREKVALEENS